MASLHPHVSLDLGPGRAARDFTFDERSRAHGDRVGTRGATRFGRADKNTTGLVYATADAGFENFAVETLVTKALIPKTVGTSDSGPAFSVGAGARILLATIGVRYRVANFSSFRLRSVSAEVGFHVPARRFEPYLVVGAGYAHLVAAADERTPADPLDLTGLDLQAGLGVDYYLTRSLAIGAKLLGDALVFTRPGVDYERSPQEQATECLGRPTLAQAKQCAMDKIRAADGSSLAASGSFALGLSVRF